MNLIYSHFCPPAVLVVDHHTVGLFTRISYMKIKDVCLIYLRRMSIRIPQTSLYPMHLQ